MKPFSKELLCYWKDLPISYIPHLFKYEIVFIEMFVFFISWNCDEMFHITWVIFHFMSQAPELFFRQTFGSLSSLGISVMDISVENLYFLREHSDKNITIALTNILVNTNPFFITHGIVLKNTIYNKLSIKFCCEDSRRKKLLFMVA